MLVIWDMTSLQLKLIIRYHLSLDNSLVPNKQLGIKWATDDPVRQDINVSSPGRFNLQVIHSTK